ncbi:MAG: phosphodiesterase [Clostridia bacterium]|nr:phosphodiesterase [Clostridia bacterium]
MKLFIASDIHGSAYYCQKLIDAFHKENADRILLLGDILYHGPRNDLPRDYAPKEVIAMLNPLSDRIICVRGNCDGEVDDMVLDFPVLAEYAIISDCSLGENIIFATHGHHFNASKLPKLKNGDVLLHGHTHIPTFENVTGIFVVNPGSVSIPKENSEHSYMIFENSEFVRKSLDGEILAVNKVGL